MNLSYDINVFEMMMKCLRYVKIRFVSLLLPRPFSDRSQAGGFATEALGWAVEQGLITGKEDRILDPKGKATRAEVAAILIRYLTKN